MSFVSPKEAEKDVNKLPPRLKEKLKVILREQVAPNPRCGKRLVGDLAGFLSLRLSRKDRVVYSIDFWSLAPVIAIFMVATPFLVPKWTGWIALMLAAFLVTGIALILGMFNPSRFGWAFRVVSAMVFLVYVAYALSELIENDWKLKRPSSKSEANPVNALIGLGVIGGPALVYTILGRFTFHREEDEGDHFNSGK